MLPICGACRKYDTLIIVSVTTNIYFASIYCSCRQVLVNLSCIWSATRANLFSTAQPFGALWFPLIDSNPGFNDAGDGIEKNMSFLVIVNHKLHSTTRFLVSSTNAKKKSKKEIEQQQKKFT